jgi:hypothetical protein
MRSVVCRLALAAATVTALLVPAVATAQTPVELGVKYLEKVQESEEATGAPKFGGDWALTAMAAGHQAAADVRRGGSKSTVYAREWYESFIAPSSWPPKNENPATEFEKAALVSYAAGIEPARVSVERNLFANIISEYQKSKPGYYGKPGRLEGTIFAVLALADAKMPMTGIERTPLALLKQSVEVIEQNEHTDGGWTYAGEEASLTSAAEPDTTGAAMAALCTSGVKNTAEEEAVANGKKYLKSILEKDGAFEYIEGPNADSDAWAVSGLNMCGIKASEFKKEETGAESPIQFMESLQIKSGEDEGGFLYKSGGKLENYTSQDAVRALAGDGFTAEPPTPTRTGQEQWNKYPKKFSTTKSSPLALIINNGSSLAVCSVPVKAGSTEEESSISLQKVLQRAETGGEEIKPSGCVSKFESSGGAITSINGTAAAWKASLNGNSEAEAKLTTPVELGTVIYLNT